MINIAHLLNLFFRQLHILLLVDVLTPSTQVDKQHLSLSVAEHTTVTWTTFLVVIQYPKSNTDISGIKHVSWQHDNRLYLIILYQLLANIFGIIIIQRTIGKQEASNTFSHIQFTQNMENPAIVSIAYRRYIITTPARIIQQFFLTTPALLVEWRICHNVIHFPTLMLVVRKRTCRMISQIIADSTNSKVHLAKTVGGRFTFLAINANRLCVTTMSLNHFHTLHEHTTRTASWVVDGTIVWLQNRSNEFYNTMRRIKFTLFLIRIDRERLQEVFIDSTYQIMLCKLFRIYLVYLITYLFQDTRFKSRLRKNLLWKCIL